MGLCAGTDSQASPFQMRTMVHVQAYRDIRKMHEQIRGMTKMARTIYICVCVYIYFYIYIARWAATLGRIGGSAKSHTCKLSRSSGQSQSARRRFARFGGALRCEESVFASALLEAGEELPKDRRQSLRGPPRSAGGLRVPLCHTVPLAMVACRSKTTAEAQGSGVRSAKGYIL